MKFGKSKDTPRIDVPTDIWERYERGVDYNRGSNLYAQVDKNYRFYAGDQWRGANLGSMSKVQENIIKAIVLYKVSTIAQNVPSVTYSPNVFELLKDQPQQVDYQNDMLQGGMQGFDQQQTFIETAQATCDKLNAHTSKLWEINKMDTVMWDSLLTAAIAGDQYLYFYYSNDRGEVECEAVDTTNIYFGNENEDDIQKQPYIIIAFRRPVADVREEAKRNGVDESLISQITSDEETNEQSGDAAKREIEKSSKEDDGKCMVLMELRKKTGKNGVKSIWSTKSTQSVVIQEPQDHQFSLYPIAALSWETIKGSIRGDGEVKYLIDNQIEINKTLARRAVAVMQSAYPKMIVDDDAVTDPEELIKAGAVIHLKNATTDDVSKKIAYLNPANTSSDAVRLSEELRTVTKDLSGASEAALGNVNPEQASGSAILAVRDASAIPLSRQVAKYKQFVEDIGRIIFDMWAVYYTDGKPVLVTQKDESGNEIDDANGQAKQTVERIPYDVLQKLRVNVNVDVSNTSPYSKYAVEQSLENYLKSGYITFDDYVDALPDDASAPKYKLKQIIAKQSQQLAQQQLEQQQSAQQAAQQPLQQVEQIPQQEAQMPVIEPQEAQPAQEEQEQEQLLASQGTTEADLIKMLRLQYPGMTDEELVKMIYQ